MVACGSADGYFEYGIHCWDVCAGDLILREAGGVTMMPTGEYGIHCWDVCAGDLILREAGGVTMMPTGEYGIHCWDVCAGELGKQVESP